jgi:hypothetical protein
MVTAWVAAAFPTCFAAAVTFTGQFQYELCKLLGINCACIKQKSRNPLVTHSTPKIILMSCNGTLLLRCGFSVLRCSLDGFMPTWNQTCHHALIKIPIMEIIKPCEYKEVCSTLVLLGGRLNHFVDFL